MEQPTVTLELAGDAKLSRDLNAGGVFVASCPLAFNDDCELVVRGPGGELRLAARVVYVAPTGGAGLEIVGFNATIKEQLENLVTAGLGSQASTTDGDAEDERWHDDDTSPGHRGATMRGAPPPASPGETGETDGDGPSAEDDSERDGDPQSTEGATSGETGADPQPTEDAGASPGTPRKLALNMQERLRGLTLAQQVKMANSNDPNVRTTLERMYGKNVWEALLRNTRLTAPEVARIARMGTLPRINIEAILNNGGWLQVPEVRRALLSNPRLGTDQIVRVLRLTPKHELKLAATQTAYPFAVRDAAKRLLKEDA